MQSQRYARDQEYKEAIPVTRLRKMMLEELQRRNYSEHTTRSGRLVAVSGALRGTICESRSYSQLCKK